MEVPSNTRRENCLLWTPTPHASRNRYMGNQKWSSPLVYNSQRLGPPDLGQSLKSCEAKLWKTLKITRNHLGFFVLLSTFIFYSFWVLIFRGGFLFFVFLVCLFCLAHHPVSEGIGSDWHPRCLCEQEDKMVDSFFTVNYLLLQSVTSAFEFWDTRASGQRRVCPAAVCLCGLWRTRKPIDPSCSPLTRTGGWLLEANVSQTSRNLTFPVVFLRLRQQG